MSTLTTIAFKYLLPLLLKDRVVNATPLSDKDRALQTVKNKEGSVTVILGTRDTGKSVAAYRVAEFFTRPTYAITPEQPPPGWVTRITLEEVEERVPKHSTIVLDDLPVTMGNRDYNNKLVQIMEKIIPMVRHEREWHLIFCSQSAAQADKYILDCELALLKPLGILMADVERPAINKIYREWVNPEFDGKSEIFVKKHAYMISRSFRGLISVAKS